MDDITLIAIGRQFTTLMVQAEQMYRENQALKAKVAELEKRLAE